MCNYTFLRDTPSPNSLGRTFSIILVMHVVYITLPVHWKEHAIRLNQSKRNSSTPHTLQEHVDEYQTQNTVSDK